MRQSSRLFATSSSSTSKNSSSLSSRCSLIRNGTRRRLTDGCCSGRLPKQASPSARAAWRRHERAPSIPSAPEGSHRLQVQAAARSNRERQASKVSPSNAQATKKLVFSSRQQSRQTKLIISHLVCCLLAAVIIRPPIEAACKSIESQPAEQAVLLGGNSLLNNNINQQQQRNQSNTQQATTTSEQSAETHSSEETSEPTTLADRIASFLYRTRTQVTTTGAPQPETATSEEGRREEAREEAKEEAEEENGSGTGRDDDDAESCAGLSADGPAETANLTDNERLVNLQSCFQRKVRRQLMGATRNGMEMFEKLSLSGACSSSLMSLSAGLGGLKSWAFKFLDASAKLPSGMMFGLLSDYGDFDQCMSIRSNRGVEPEQEPEEVGAFSGKYCLMSLKLNYRVKLAANETVPAGIVEDGILWDELVRHYWTSNISKGFQVGVCFPSRCTDDDLQQLYQHVANSFNVIGEIISCQDNLDLKRQYEPDLLQRTILGIFYALIGLAAIGTLIDRYCFRACSSSWAAGPLPAPNGAAEGCGPALRVARVLLCFSVARNWSQFMRRKSGQLRAEQQKQQPDPASFWSSRGRGLVAEVLGGRKGASNHNTPSSAARSVTEQSTLTNRESTTTVLSAEVDYIDTDSDSPSSSSSSSSSSLSASYKSEKPANSCPTNKPLSVRIDPFDASRGRPSARSSHERPQLAHLSGLKLLIIIWITVGYSFLYPSAHNYQYYRSIIKMNFTRDSVWFATTNFTLGIDMLLYITGLLFVYKLLGRPVSGGPGETMGSSAGGVLSLISRKAVRFWPTYLAVIGLAIVVPLLSDGPMWPEMVSKKLSQSCRNNWWANLLFINNYLGQADICLPSSWFISILMQLFFVGSIIVVLVRKVSLEAALAVLTALLASSFLYSFGFAYFYRLRAPVIKMDESFVMDLDEGIFSLYTNIFNNLGPFLVGMAGGILLLRVQKRPGASKSSPSRAAGVSSVRRFLLGWLGELSIGLAMVAIAILVLSSVFHENYTRLASSLYWSLHRIGWALVTGYLVHQCATGKWKLLNDLLSLSAFAPLSRLIFIAYLVYPIYVHIHTGLVRDGLHVSIYNMLTIYITRLVMTFVTALLIHLLVELPFSTMEENYLSKWITNRHKSGICSAAKVDLSKMHPLLVVAEPKQGATVIGGGGEATHLDRESDQPSVNLQANNSFDELLSAQNVRKS